MLKKPRSNKEHQLKVKPENKWSSRGDIYGLCFVSCMKNEQLIARMSGSFETKLRSIPEEEEETDLITTTWLCFGTQIGVAYALSYYYSFGAEAADSVVPIYYLSVLRIITCFFFHFQY